MLLGCLALSIAIVAMMASHCFVCCPKSTHQCSAIVDGMQRASNCSGIVQSCTSRLLSRNLDCKRPVMCWGKGRGLAELASLSNEKKLCAVVSCIEYICTSWLTVDCRRFFLFSPLNCLASLLALEESSQSLIFNGITILTKHAHMFRPFRKPLKRHQVPPAQPVPDHIPKPVWYDGKSVPRKPSAEIHDQQVRCPASGEQFSVSRLLSQLLHSLKGQQSAENQTRTSEYHLRQSESIVIAHHHLLTYQLIFFCSV